MSDDTPVPSNGAATGFDFEDTGPIHGAISNMPSAHDVAAALINLSGGASSGSPPGVPPEEHRKQIKRHNWAAVLLAMLLGPGGAMTVVYATSDRSKTNEVKVEATAKTLESNIEPRLDKTEGDIRYIKAEIKNFGEKVDTAMEQQKIIVDGIEDLKQENVKRLEDELREAKRELRRRHGE